MLYLVCLCAEWCGACREFRVAIESLGGFRGRVYWIDIEAQAELVDGFDIEALPTIAIVDRFGQVRFAGPVEPAAVGRLVRAAPRQRPIEVGPEWQPVLAALPNLQPVVEITDAED
jgi:thioredoxin